MTTSFDHQRSRTSAETDTHRLLQDCARYMDLSAGEVVDVKTVSVTQVTIRDPEHLDRFTEFVCRHYPLGHEPDRVTEEGMLGRAHKDTQQTLFEA